MIYLQKKYQFVLEFVLNRQGIAVFAWLLSIIFGITLYQATPKELSPQENQGYLMVMGSGPVSANQNYILGHLSKINKALSSLPNARSYLLLQGIPSLNGFMGFDILNSKTNLNIIQTKNLLQRALNGISGINAYASVPSPFPGDSGSYFQFVISSTADYIKLYTMAKKFERDARNSRIFSYLDDDLNYRQTNLQLDFNRDTLAAYHVSMNRVSDSLQLLTGTVEVQQFDFLGRSYDVIMGAYPRFRNNPDKLNLIMVRNDNGGLVPLSNLMTSRISIRPSSLNEFQKENSVTITGFLTSNTALSTAIDYAQKWAFSFLHENMRYDYSGQTRQYIEEKSRFIQIFCLSLLIIFLILSIQFNNFKDSLLILLGSVPMALFAALIPLKCGFGTINMYTQIALLTLVGLIAKHGVLMTNYANQLKAKGESKSFAIHQAALTRFRPIVMTTAAMVFGALPLVIATGAGSISRFQIGLTISTGLTIGTACTLLIFPALYKIFSEEHKCHAEFGNER